MRRLEFWPDYEGALLHEDGRSVPIEELALSDDLVSEIGRWLPRYDDAKLEPSTRDDAWVAEGARLFDRLREALRPRGIEVVDWEGYWARSGDDD